MTPTSSVIRVIAEIVAGLQVPYSISPKMLGTAGVAWARLRDRIPAFFGWQDADETEEILRRHLTEAEP